MGLKIWHLGDVHWTPESVNGVNIAVREIAREQAAAGHEVSVLVEGAPSPAASSFAEETGVTLLSLRPGLLGAWRSVRHFIRESRPDIVHMHSVFVPQHCKVAFALSAARIPYVATPHGGLASQVLSRNRLKKLVYGLLLEKPRFKRSASITLVAPEEQSEIRAYLPSFKGFTSWVPNPVESPAAASDRWAVPSGSPQIVFLGRFDVQHKGIDVLVDLARRVPEADFHLYGQEDSRTKAELEELKSTATPNVFFHGPVFNEQKARVLSEATLYLQPSRWEAFGISVAEAMCLGTPCAITSTMNMASLFQEHALGLVIPDDAAVAAESIRTAVQDTAQLLYWSEAGRQFARMRFKPSVVADQFLTIYRRSINGAGSGRLQVVKDPDEARAAQ